MNQDLLNQILQGYITAALWTEEERLKDEQSSDNDLIYGDNQDEEDFDDDIEKIVRLASNMDKKGFDRFSKEDIEVDSLLRAYKDINEFINKVGEENIESAIIDDNVDIETIGHHLWLSRNGHGSGFFDGDYEYFLEKKLMKAAKEMGSVDLYINDNNKLSFSNEHIWENKKKIK